SAIRTAGPSSMNPKNDTGPARGTLIFSAPPRRALSGLSRDGRQNAVVPRNVSPIRVTCAAFSSLALPMRSGEGLRSPRRGLVVRGLIDGSSTILPIAISPSWPPCSRPDAPDYSKREKIEVLTNGQIRRGFLY